MMDNTVPAIIINPSDDNISMNIGVNNVSMTKSFESISTTLVVTLSAAKMRK